jgi:diphthamide synthase (EF-2-diphthine--ammonia ligase)
MTPLRRIWRRDTDKVVAEFIAAGFKAITVCIDPAKLGPSFAGRVIDARFVADLATEVDPCGENGEFHSFVFDGPLFTRPVGFSIGELVYRDAFWFRDLAPLV